MKIPLYARHGIPEVWLLDLRNMRLEVYADCRGGEYRHIDYHRRGKVSAIQIGGLTIDLDTLLCRR